MSHDVRTVGSQLRKHLTTEARAHGVVSVSALWPSLPEPIAVWTPEESDEPAFLAYSVTKTFTSALVLMLCEDGRLSLDDPLARWYSDVDRAQNISLRQLLNHTGGIPDYGGLPTYHESVRNNPSQPWSFERFAAETFDRGLLFEPGQGWAYSNPGYMLVKRVIEGVTGDSYRTLIAERIAGPLGLRRTFVPESIADLTTLAAGTSSLLASDGTCRDVRSHYHPGWVSHGVVASTASDLVRFLDGLFRGRLLSQDSLDQMLTLIPVTLDGTKSDNPPPLRPAQPGYGLGVMGDPASPWGLIVGHNGGGPCYSASAFHALGLGGLSVCAMGAIERGFSAERIVAGVFDSWSEVETGRSR
jgi:D-alanyl-D-alanine carboxypeptidase